MIPYDLEPEQLTPIYEVSPCTVTAWVYLSGEEPKTQVPLLAQGVLAKHVSVRIHEHWEEFNMYPGPQIRPQAIEKKYMYRSLLLCLFCS